MAKKRLQNKTSVTNDRDRIKVLIVGILIIIAVIIAGFALGQYGNMVEAHILGNS